MKEQNPDLPSRFSVQGIGGPRKAGHEDDRVDPSSTSTAKKAGKKAPAKKK